MAMKNMLDKLKKAASGQSDALKAIEGRVDSLDKKLADLDSAVQQGPKPETEQHLASLKQDVSMISSMLSEAIKIEVQEKDKIEHLEKLYGISSSALENLEFRVNKLDELVKDPTRKDVVVMHDPELAKIKKDVEELKKSTIRAAKK